MKKLFIVLFVFVLGSSAKAQWYYTSSVLPPHPTTSDSIYLRDSISLAYQSMQLYFSHVHDSNGVYTIHQCYDRAYGATTGRTTSEITPLGKLPAGSYSGVFYSHMQTDSLDTDCSQYGVRDSLRFAFTVSEPTGLSEVAAFDPVISPNPAAARLYLDLDMVDVSISITDLTGRSYTVPHTGREIDVSALATGVYILRLQDRAGSVVRRFVRE